jgi:hypothetical protein
MIVEFVGFYAHINEMQASHVSYGIHCKMISSTYLYSE